MSVDITTGDDITISATLKKDTLTFTIDTSATVKAVLVNTARTRQISAVVTCDSAYSGADWANSLVVVKFTSAESAAITQMGSALLEIQVDDGGKSTWTSPVTIYKGNID